MLVPKPSCVPVPALPLMRMDHLALPAVSSFVTQKLGCRELEKGLRSLHFSESINGTIMIPSDSSPDTHSPARLPWSHALHSLAPPDTSLLLSFSLYIPPSGIFPHVLAMSPNRALCMGIWEGPSTGLVPNSTGLLDREWGGSDNL